jgi:NAD(P)-dependent dehydrogenase (short-subunit alcohol dehydrogenase family)
MHFRDRVVIVTGGATGIGRAICDRFSEHGARVVIACRNVDKGVRAVEEIKAQGGQALYIETDITLEGDVERLFGQTLHVYDGLHVLVNNASSFVFRSIYASVEEWREVLDTNVIGTALCSKHGAAIMREQGGGAIVNIASISAHIAQRDLLTYNTTKAAIVEMTRCMALDLAPYNIRVNSVSPGYILTEHQAEKIKSLGMTIEQAEREWGGLHILNRMGKPEEVAHAVLFLASEESSFITGTDLLVDGGYTAL